MPKEDHQAHVTPLKRGDACLYCRKRRIKCSAAKPSCQHCAKAGRECVYDSGKPVSRVKQLEEKVAELETMLRAGADGSRSTQGDGEGRTSSSESIPQMPPFRHQSSSDSLSGLGMDASSDGQTRANGLFDHHVPSGGANASGGINMNGTLPAMPPFYQRSSSDSASEFGMDTFQASDLLGTRYMQEAPMPSTSTAYSLPMDPNAITAESFDYTMFESILGSQHTQTQSQAQPPRSPAQASAQQTSYAQFQSAMFTNTSHVEPPGSGNYELLSMSRTDTSTALEAFDFNMLDPAYTSLLSSFESSMSPTAQVPEAAGAGYPALNMTLPASDPASAYTINPAIGTGQGGPLPGNLYSATGTTPRPWIPIGPQPVSYSPQRTPQASATPTPGQIRASALLEQIRIPPPDGTPTPIGMDDIREKHERQWATGVTEAITPPGQKGPSGADLGLGSADDEGFQLIGGWFDAADLPKVARDHLLDIFFSNLRLFGQEGIHVPRFMASLTLPPAKRPHPCVLYSMYTMASRVSTSPSIRTLEPHFYSIAAKQLEESIANADRLLDATRASTLLAIYKYSKARYHEGWMMTGQAARLAISCGLHQIKSSVWKPPITTEETADLSGIMRHRSYVVPPAKDPVEHGERIWSLWTIYATDRCGAISTQWPPAMPDEVIHTPFPKPLHEYELGLVTTEDDRSLASLYEKPLAHRPLPHYMESTLISARLRGIGILERASKLMYLPAEEGWDHNLSLDLSKSTGGSPVDIAIDDYLYSQMAAAAGMPNVNASARSRSGSADTGRSTGVPGWTRCAKIRTPKAYEEVKQALLRIEADLAPEWRVNWFVWDGKLQDWHFKGKPRKELVTLDSQHFVLGCAWMFLFDVFSFNAENTDAVHVAQRLTATVKQLSQTAMTTDLDVFIAMTWTFISKILIREMKRLHLVGDHAGATVIEAEVQILIDALRDYGRRYTIATMQALRAERYKAATTEETAFLEGDDVED
ncbi:hypothetical protein IAU60_005023 [Kwoniella sp. DSM 27419]